jgi:hypothetical protein
MGRGLMDRQDAERRARRLLRWYPKAWRQRYGDEFTELLTADIGERPRSRRRTLDVVRRGLAARIAPRPAVAIVVLVASLAACAWILGTFITAPIDPAQIACGTHCTPQIVMHLRATESWRVKHLTDANWAISLAVGIGLGGAATALLICYD